jgi:hypothetical protein
MWSEFYVLTYDNGKVKSVETIARMEEERLKENDRGGEFNSDILEALL